MITTSSDHKTINFEINCTMPTPVPTSHLNFHYSDMLSLVCMFRDIDWINIVLPSDNNNNNTLISNFNNIFSSGSKVFFGFINKRRTNRSTIPPHKQV